MNRRRAIALLGAAALTSCRQRETLRTFSDIAFGTGVYFQTYGITEIVFQEISEKCSARLRELESLFSLYDTDSAICRLNRDGKLENPPAEFLHLLRTALDFGEKTGGVFDITVQPLWNWRQQWKNADITGRGRLEGRPWEETLSLVDFRNVIVSENAVEFAESGMAITLNAIVQGYATDEIVSLLLAHGIKNALVNIGEYAALGNAPGGELWSLELSTSNEQIALPTHRALAVSAGSGHTFDPEGRFHHIFRPSDGTNTRPDSTIVVTAPSATMADALSTTLAIATEPERMKILKKFPEADFQEIR